MPFKVNLASNIINAMEELYIPPSILRLPGISLQDYHPVEEIFDTRILDVIHSRLEDMEISTKFSEEMAPSHMFDRIPSLFTGMKNWPHRTNLYCWTCGFAFIDPPKFVPTFIREGKTGIEMGVRGNMCSFNCAESWILLNSAGRENSEERWNAQEALRILHFIFTGYWVEHINPAPSKTVMQQYGGELDGREYKNRLQEIDPVFMIRSKDAHTREFTNQGKFAPEDIGSFLASTGSRLKPLKDIRARIVSESERKKLALERFSNNRYINSSTRVNSENWRTVCQKLDTIEDSIEKKEESLPLCSTDSDTSNTIQDSISEQGLAPIDNNNETCISCDIMPTPPCVVETDAKIISKTWDSYNITPPSLCEIKTSTEIDSKTFEEDYFLLEELGLL